MNDINHQNRNKQYICEIQEVTKIMQDLGTIILWLQSYFKRSAIWSDEVVCKLNGHNCTYWRSKNSHEIIEKERNLPRVTLERDFFVQIFWHYFFNGTASGSFYLETLSELLWLQIESRMQRWWTNRFQHDGTTAHFAVILRELHSWMQSSS